MKQYWSGRGLVEAWTLQEVLHPGVNLSDALSGSGFAHRLNRDKHSQRTRRE